MKSATIAAALLASVAVAQPHGHKRQHHHEKRDLVTEWETVWETATVVIDDDSTQTIGPSPHETSSGYPGQFFQGDASSPSSAATSTVEATEVATPEVTTAEVATAEALPQTAQTTPTTTISLTQPTYQAASPTTTLITTTSPAAPTYPTTTEEATTEEAATSTYAASPAASSTGSSSGGSTSSDGIQYNTEFSGEITYYNAALGACGYEDTGKDDSENIVAIPKDFWDSISTATSYGINQPAHPLCDKTITITASDGTKTKATIRDRCGGCAGHAIDVTPHTFSELFGSLDGGRLDCTWEIDE
ncbi:hypothetical protein F4821DRAFT_225106 [Hypoxylon rubiginosum]|uniref:Uncharacterized protein n=1 Tax=Hypoxylon rubiginosum TaxID=110542 RepID=A0ACC0DH90_9PEZI|nr:hypothetical protein F4821DRAFT_225106 [Hypoxylon rubiginosum]